MLASYKEAVTAENHLFLLYVLYPLELDHMGFGECLFLLPGFTGQKAAQKGDVTQMCYKIFQPLSVFSGVRKNAPQNGTAVGMLGLAFVFSLILHHFKSKIVLTLSSY